MTRSYRIRKPSRRRLTGDPHDVSHVIEAGRPSDNPMGRANRTAREDRTVGRAMRELDALALANQIEGVLAHDVAPA